MSHGSALHLPPVQLVHPNQKAIESKKLADDVQKFLDEGGKIVQLKQGEMGKPFEVHRKRVHIVISKNYMTQEEKKNEQQTS